MAYQSENETVNKKDQNQNSNNESGFDAEKTKGNIYNASKEIKDQVYNKSKEIKDQASQYISNSVNTVKNSTASVKDSIADYAADKPFKAIGMAVAAGALFGYLFGRK